MLYDNNNVPCIHSNVIEDNTTDSIYTYNTYTLDDVNIMYVNITLKLYDMYSVL